MANEHANFDRRINEAERKARNRDKRAPFSLTRRTLKQLQKLYRYRYGLRLPDDDASREYLAAAFMYISTKRERVSFARAWTPWLSPDTALDLAETVGPRPTWPNARTLGEMLQITYAEIRALNIRGIRPVDKTDAELAEINRLKRNARRQMNRAQKRAEKPTISQSEPWVAAGISRATWYRRKKAAESETKHGPCNTTSIIGTGFCLTPAQESMSANIDPQSNDSLGRTGQGKKSRAQAKPSSFPQIHSIEGAAPAARKALNELWRPAAKGRRYAVASGIPSHLIDNEAENFVGWHRKGGKTPWPNVDAAWESWCDRYTPYETERRERHQRYLRWEEFWADKAA